jgi:hypothetical protein
MHAETSQPNRTKTKPSNNTTPQSHNRCVRLIEIHLYVYVYVYMYVCMCVYVCMI